MDFDTHMQMTSYRMYSCIVLIPIKYKVFISYYNCCQAPEIGPIERSHITNPKCYMHGERLVDMKYRIVLLSLSEKYYQYLYRLINAILTSQLLIRYVNKVLFSQNLANYIMEVVVAQQLVKDISFESCVSCREIPSSSTKKVFYQNF